MRYALLLVLTIYNLSFAQKDIPKDHMIVYFFLGHSNMACYGVKSCLIDTSLNSRLWMYGREKGIYHGTMVSTVAMFLHAMAMRYPDYNFCGAYYAVSGMRLVDMVNDTNRLIKDIHDLSYITIIGGVLSMFGFREGEDSMDAVSLDKNYLNLFCAMETATENRFLPCLIGRYEETPDSKPDAKYLKYKDLVIKSLQQIASESPMIKMFPIEPIAPKHYSDDHHYNCSGYTICFEEDAPALIQLNHFDFWNKK